MNNISSLTEQTITLVPSAEFCIPVLSFVLCLLHCTVPSLSGQICSFPQLPVSGNQGDGRRRVNIFFTETLRLIRPRIDKSENMVHNEMYQQCIKKSDIFCFGCVAFWPLHSLYGDSGVIFFAILINLKLYEHLFKLVSFMLMIIWSFLPSNV